MSSAFLSAPSKPLHKPLRLSTAPVVIAAKSVGAVLYGDESRTRASLFFAFGCVSLYAVALSKALLCSLGGF